MAGVAGLVLAGGASTRFGGEKAAALLAGRPLLAWALAALAPACEMLAVSAGRGTEAEAIARALGCAVLRDDPAHAAGPLSGVAAGLSWARQSGATRLVTLPCDTPLVRARDVCALLAGTRGTGAAYAVTDDGPQALCAVWPAGVDLRPSLAAGEHPAVRDCLADLDAAQVRLGAARFRNLNHRRDLADLERACAGQARARMAQ